MGKDKGNWGYNRTILSVTYMDIDEDIVGEIMWPTYAPENTRQKQNELV